MLVCLLLLVVRSCLVVALVGCVELELVRLGVGFGRFGLLVGGCFVVR